MDQNVNIVPVNIEDEMRKSYMDYAMSVIIGRALPDVRDGLKPVQRRILYAMEDMGLQWNKQYKKSARVVGDVIGKYHPHGDAAVYEALVRMAQDFSMRIPLIDGQGNFGSMDGDPPAAMRYTEVKMARIASAMLADIEKETVNFTANYDNTLTEPVILPSKVPNLLVNGSSGIAVGMATNIPPHNLGEVVDALLMLISNQDCSIDELIHLVPGPDFPTGGLIYGTEGLKEAYENGRGTIQLRAKAHIEKRAKGDREDIIITEIPFQVNKARLVERIAELVQEKKIDGIADIRDESDRDGVRIVVELKKDGIGKVILNQLYRLTPMQSSFGIILLAIVENQPQILTLKEILHQFIEFRKEIVIRRTRFDLRKAEERAHILEGLKIALDNLDAIIKLIRSSQAPAEAKARLMQDFNLSELQAQAILDMRLQRLTGLEREKINEEYLETIKLMEKLRHILENDRLVLEIISEELTEIKQIYADSRRTALVERVEDISVEDLIVEEQVVVTVSNTGYIKRNALSLYRTQGRGGKGVTGMTTREEDFVETLFVASTHDYVLIFTNRGRVYWLKVHEIPEGGRAARGRPIVNLIKLLPEESIAAILPVSTFEEGRYVVMATKKGVIKKTALSAFSHPRADGIIAAAIDEGDSLIDAQLTDGSREIFLGSKNGLAIRFHEDILRPIGRVARGVRGMSLECGDEVVGMEVLSGDATILTITEHGYGKRTKSSEYRIQGRGGKGIITIKTTERNGSVVGIKQVIDDDHLMIITSTGKIIRIAVSDISVIGRNTQGVRLITIEKDEKVVGVARLAEQEA
jgi:DNA gyrase subunit A